MFQAHTAGVHRTEEGEEGVCLSRVLPVSGLRKVRQFRAQLCNQECLLSGLKGHLCHSQAVPHGTGH